ncbi:MAG TPA: YceI family protein [Rudaea sp.]|nr:YceI family protein [Rudaea sp.]
MNIQPPIFCHLIARPAAVVLLLVAGSAWASDYRFDTVHSQVLFCVSHLGFSNPCGRMRVKSGSFQFDKNHWELAKVDVVVDTASLAMGDAKWDAMLRSWQFLETDKYPVAHYVSTDVTKTGDHGAIVHGKLSLRGKTRPVDLHVTFNRAGIDPYSFRYTAGFSATTTLKRSDFGISKYLPDIGDEVTLRIEVEGLRGAVSVPLSH